jgi:hypothetical protein
MAKKSEAPLTSTRLTLDRIEEGTAVLVSDEGVRVNIPASILPPGVSEGTVLDLTIAADLEETLRRIDAVRDLQRRLLEGND